MIKEEYIRTVTDQLRCEKVKGMISEEIGNHIDDQADAYEQQGMNREKALYEAVKDMGDPVDTGVSLDRIHRPQMAWKMLLLIGIISIVGMVVQVMIGSQDVDAYVNFNFRKQLMYVVIGSGIMLLICFVDYSTVGRYAGAIGALFCLFLFINIFFTGITFNGSVRYIRIFNINISMAALMYLYIPIYGAILYRHREEGYRAVGSCLIWLIIPVFLAMRMPLMGLALNLLVALLVLLTMAVIKGWFAVNKKIVLLPIWGVFILSPVLIIVLAFGRKQTFLTAYQAARIKAFLDPAALGGADYTVGRVRELVRASRMVGMNRSDIKTYDYLPSVNIDYILTHLISYYGILAAAVIVLLLFLLIRKIFRVALSQKNQLGMIMGCGCGLAYGIQAATYILQNLGIWPTTEVFLPLFSYGGTGTVVSYTLLGILLSIYRYQNIIPVRASKGKRLRLFAAL